MTLLLSKYIHSFISRNSRKNMELFTFILLICFDSLANHSENTHKYDPRADVLRRQGNICS